MVSRTFPSKVTGWDRELCPRAKHQGHWHPQAEVLEVGQRTSPHHPRSSFHPFGHLLVPAACSALCGSDHGFLHDIHPTPPFSYPLSFWLVLTTSAGLFPRGDCSCRRVTTEELPPTAWATPVFMNGARAHTPGLRLLFPHQGPPHFTFAAIHSPWNHSVGVCPGH